MISARIPVHSAQVDIPGLSSGATTVFRGFVSSIVPGKANPWGTRGALAQFVVDRWYRGTGPATIDVPFSYSSQSVVDGHDCIDFRTGGYWIVFANGEGKSLALVDDCEGALPVSSRVAIQTSDTTNWLSGLIEDFAACLQDASSEARIVSLQRLGNLRSRQILPFLEPFLRSKDAPEFEWAVYSSLRAGDAGVLSLARELLEKYPDRHLPELFMQREIMEIRDKGAVADLLAILHGDGPGRLAAIVALGEIGDRSVLPEIASHLADPDRHVRYEVVAAIQKLQPTPACQLGTFSSGDELDAIEQACLAWWKQVGAIKSH